MIQVANNTRLVWFNYKNLFQQKIRLKKASISRIKNRIKLIFSIDDLTTEMHIRRCKAAKHNVN